MENNEEYKYSLIAHNEQGSSAVFHGDTIREVFIDFNSEYSQRGFKIKIINNQTGDIIQVKKTLRWKPNTKRRQHNETNN